MNFGTPGTQRIAQQGFLLPTNHAMRVYNVHFVSTITITNLVLANRSGGTTASAALTDFLTVHSSEQGRGYWDSSAGMRFPLGVFIETSANFVYATVVCQTEA